VCPLGLEDKVMFLGHVSQKKLLVKMANANFFLLMSRYESERLPNVVKEAMYQRCIVVTSDTQGINELVNHGKSW
jgi:glycosyltransferase involved in cell wall biosynthesis